MEKLKKLKVNLNVKQNTFRNHIGKSIKINQTFMRNYIYNLHFMINKFSSRISAKERWQIEIYK